MTVSFSFYVFKKEVLKTFCDIILFVIFGEG